MKNKKILFVCYGGGHARMLKPVIILAKEKYEVQVLALTTAHCELKDLGVTLLRYSDFFSSDEIIELGEFCLKSLDKVIDRDESIIYLGVNLKELVDKFGYTEAIDLYTKHGRYIFDPINALHRILVELKPDLLVTTNSPRSERAAVIAANDLDIPSVAFIDMFGIRCASWFKFNDFANKILVLSESVKDYYISLGRNESDIVVTGNPSFDSLANYYHTHHDDIKIKREKRKPTVLWASQPEPSYLAEFDAYGDPNLPVIIENRLFKIFEENKNWQLIARNHPSEVQRDYPESTIISPQSQNMVELLESVDVVVTPSSTVGFQGIVMGAQLVTIDLSVLTQTMPYATMGFSTGVTSLDDLEFTISKVIANNEPSGCRLYSERFAAQKAFHVITSFL